MSLLKFIGVFVVVSKGCDSGVAPIRGLFSLTHPVVDPWILAIFCTSQHCTLACRMRGAPDHFFPTKGLSRRGSPKGFCCF